MSKTDLEKFVEYFVNNTNDKELKFFIAEQHPKKNENKYFSFIRLVGLQHFLQHEISSYSVQHDIFIDYDKFLDEIKTMVFHFQDKKINIERYFNFVANVDRFLENLPDLNRFLSLKLFLQALKETLLSDNTFNMLGEMYSNAYGNKFSEVKRVERFGKGIAAVMAIYKRAAEDYSLDNIQAIQKIIKDFYQAPQASTNIAPYSSFHQAAPVAAQSVSNSYEHPNEPHKSLELKD